MCASISSPTMARSSTQRRIHALTDPPFMHSAVLCVSDRSGPTAATESCNPTLDSGYHMLPSL